MTLRGGMGACETLGGYYGMDECMTLRGGMEGV